MCVSCGCGKFEDAHGDERNISVSALQRAAAAANLTIDQVLDNLVAGCEEMRQSGVPDHQSKGQAIESRLHPDQEPPRMQPEDEAARSDLEAGRLDHATPERHGMDEFVPDVLEDEANVTPGEKPAAEDVAVRIARQSAPDERE